MLRFAQTGTVCLGILSIVSPLRPDWLAETPPTAPAQRPTAQHAPAPLVSSYHSAVARATASVVNIYTTKHINVPLIPTPADPELERLFREIPGFSRRKESTSLRSEEHTSELQSLMRHSYA